MTGAGDRLVLGPGVAETILDAARRDWPEETVGLLGGLGPRVLRAYPLGNLLRGRRPLACLADPHDQYLAECDLAERGLEVVGTFHSHPDGGAAPSPGDVATAHHRHLVVVAIGGLSGPDQPTARLAAWRIDGGEVASLGLVRAEATA